MRLIDKLPAAGDGLRIVAQKDADEIFLLLDAPFQVRDGGRRGIYQLLGLSHIEHRRSAAISKDLSQS